MDKNKIISNTISTPNCSQPVFSNILATMHKALWNSEIERFPLDAALWASKEGLNIMYIRKDVKWWGCLEKINAYKELWIRM